MAIFNDFRSDFRGSAFGQLQDRLLHRAPASTTFIPIDPKCQVYDAFFEIGVKFNIIPQSSIARHMALSACSRTTIRKSGSS